jgi:aryl-phospho-beta-D-glucosidase BglC (GH1 family)
MLALVAPAAAAGSPAARRAERLRHGVDLSHWFAQVFAKEGYTKAHFDAYFTARDADLVAAMGFDHVRFTVEPAPMFDEAAPDTLKADYMATFDAALDMLLARGLTVLVDVHPAEDWKARLNTDDELVESFARFWRAFAAHLSKTDPDRVVLEIINEPTVKDPYRWMGIQAKLVAAARAGAPRHTLMATGANWSSLPDLLRLEPVADPNVIYTFHLYDPHTFTHQGAGWGADYWKYLTHVPYPSSPEGVAPILPTVENDAARDALKQYGEERWNAERLDAMAAAAQKWGRDHGVPVYCGEFGVYRRYATESERTAWLHDVRTALERHGIGWALWDYAGGFAVANRKQGEAPVADMPTLTALGLRYRAR